MGLPYTIRSFMIVIVAGLGNLPGVAMSGMGLGVFEEFADYILGTEFRIGSVFLLLVLILVYSCLLYTSPSPRDVHLSRMPSSA